SAPPGARSRDMSLGRLLLHNLFYHWRGNLAVLLGVVVGTAALTGALLVGDSLRGSLRDLALRRLGWVDEVLVAPRFFRENLAEELESVGAADRVGPVILLQATAVVKGAGDTVQHQARGVTLIGADPRFWRDHRPKAWWPDRPLWLNSTLARDLNV